MTSRAVATVTAAALAAVVTVSACAPSVDGQPVAGDAPAMRPAGELKSGTGPTLAPVPQWPVWEDVSGQGLSLWDRGEPSPQTWGPIPAPGVTIVHARTPSGTMCGLGPAVRSEDDSRAGWITGGHCHPAADPLQSFNSSPDQRLVPLGEMTGAEDDDRSVDSGVIWSMVPGTATIAGTWPVAGVLTVEGAESLELGSVSPVCYSGAVSGVRCGPLESTDDGGQLRFAVDPQPGDSGAVVYLVSNGAAHLVGILAARLENSFETAGFATYLDPALQRLRARAVVDPAAAAITGQSGYSTRVTTVG